MVEQKHAELLAHILDLLDGACQTSIDMLIKCGEGDFVAVNQMAEGLYPVIAEVRTSQEPILPQLEHAYTSEMLENIEDTLDDIQTSIQSGNTGRAAMKLDSQLLPFLRCLREVFYFYGSICPDQEKMRRYYQDEFAEAYQNFHVCEEETPALQLSIVVTGYNHLETTKQCVEQLLKMTDFEQLNAELILIDHGSTDGTLEYFESLGLGRVIHFKKNARMHMFATLFQICRGKYFCFINNDILVTKNWANILLNCLETDEKIILAVPATPNTSNLQAIGLLDLPPEDYVSLANNQNRSNPSCWNERARLIPPLGMYRTAAVNRIGFADPYLYSMEYWDDDFSLRARRAGYQQILCSDVTCYHFGSVTGKADQKKEGTLVYGRELFFNKNGVDAWGNGFCYDYTAIYLVKQALPPQENVSVLGLDCGMGDTPLQVRNELRHLHRGCRIYQVTSQEAYFPDIKPHSNEAVFVARLEDGVKTAFGAETFDLAYLGRDIEEYENFSMLLESVSHRLVPGGYFIFACNNPFYALTLHALLQFSLPDNLVRYSLVNPEQVRVTAGKYFSQVQMIHTEATVNGLKGFAALHYGKTAKLSQIVKRLEINRYYFLCRA